MLNNGMKEQAVRPRKIDACFGWNCLTGAEQFGIAFSSAVVFIVLSLAYMYYLGNARTSYKRRATTQVPGGQRVKKKRKDIRSTPPVPANHTTMQDPSYEPRVVYQPLVYSIAGAQVPTTQQPAVMGLYPQWPFGVAQPPPVYYPHYAHYPTAAFSTAWGAHNTQQFQTAPGSPTPSESHPQQPTWRQRLQRVLGLPVGRASTIASSSPPASPQRRNSNLIVSRSYREESPRGERRRHIERSTRQPTASELRSLAQGRTLQALEDFPLAEDSDAASDAAQSVQTNAATVHSDDFQTVTQSHLAGLQETEPPNRGTGSDLTNPSRQATRSGQGDGFRGGDYYDTYSIPSVSSIQARTQAPSQVGHDPNEMNLLSRIQPETPSLLRERAAEFGTSLPYDREAARRQWERLQRLATDEMDPGGHNGPSIPEAVNQPRSQHHSGPA